MPASGLNSRLSLLGCEFMRVAFQAESSAAPGLARSQCDTLRAMCM